MALRRVVITGLGTVNPLGNSVEEYFTNLNNETGTLADALKKADIFVGVVILCVVGCEFFIRYSIKFRHSKKEVKA